MEFKNAELETTFSVPERPTVRQWLAYDSAVDMRIGLTTYERMWAGLQALVKPDDWSSPVDLHIDMETADDERAARVIKWASLTLFSFLHGLRNVEKN